MLGDSWQIKSRARSCCVTEQKFADGDYYYAAIFPDPESSGYLRRDFCEQAWHDRPADAEEPFSFWRGKYEVNVAETKPEVVEKNDAESLFRKMVEEDLPHTENARFILAAMLERKKIIRETDTQQLDSGKLRIYEHRKAGDVFIVKDPQIPLEQVESIQHEVTALLDPEESAGPTNQPTDLS